MQRRTWATFVLCVLFGAANAEAGLWQNMWTALDYAARPSGSPVSVTGDGTQVNGARTGRVRIVPNGVYGRGYQLEFDRTFGIDSRGRAEVFRFGSMGELTLQGGVQATAGYTKAEFGNNLRSGQLELGVTNLNYDFRTKLGAQDVEIFGTLNAINGIELSPLGFYNMQVNISNTNSGVKVDGVLAQDEKETNFDVGPINISGNIFVDLFAVALGSLGVDTSGIEELFPQSPIDQITRQIQEGLQENLSVSDAYTPDAIPLLLETVLNQNPEAGEELASALITPSDETIASLDQTEPIPPDPVSPVPEPGTAVLLVLGSAAASWRRRR